METFLNLPRHKILLNDPTKIDKNTLEIFKKAVSRLCRGEPLDYVIGFKEFLNLKLHVDKRVLIPRPETEELVEYLIEKYRGQTRVFADIGTGSGAIALALASAFPDSIVYATDISKAALEVAKANAENNRISNIIFLHGRGLTPLKPYIEEIEVIVSNPPYIKSEYIEHLDEKVKNHEPLTALDGGVDGVAFFRELFEELPADKVLYFEIATYNEPLLVMLASKKLPNYRLEFLADSRGAVRFAILNPKG